MLHLCCTTLQIEAFKVDRIRYIRAIKYVPPTRTLKNFLFQLIAKLREETPKSRRSWVPAGPAQALVEYKNDLNNSFTLEYMAEGVTEEERIESVVANVDTKLNSRRHASPARVALHVFCFDQWPCFRSSRLHHQFQFIR